MLLLVDNITRSMMPMRTTTLQGEADFDASLLLFVSCNVGPAVSVYTLVRRPRAENDVFTT